MIFCGEYDIAVRKPLRTDLSRLRDARRVVLDLSEVTFFDASAIGELIHLHNERAARSLERETAVVRKAHLLRIFKLVGLDELLELTSSLETALAQSDKKIPIGLDYTHLVVSAKLADELEAPTLSSISTFSMRPVNTNGIS
jgi:anti-anti-sigma regulatory factor